MKGILKLFPAALAVFALASCSNDDFFGSSNASGKLQLTATVEAPETDDDATRAAFVPTAMSAIWQNGDMFRVYDANLQKYDEFICDGSAIQLDGTAVVDVHAKAIFPGDQVYYAGYDKANNDVIAIMEVPSDITYGGQAKNADGSVGYVSALPMWGDVTDATSTDLKVSLSHLNAYTDITVYRKAVTNIRILAAQAGVTDATAVIGATDLTDASNAQILADASILDGTTPLAGYFEAQLKEDGVLKANATNPVLKDSYTSLIHVDLSTNAADEAHVFVPIIAGVEYANLIIQTSADNGTTWTTLKAYADATFKRNGVLRKDLVRGNAPITAHVSSLFDLNRKLNIIAKTAEYQDKIVNIYVDGVVKTGEDQNDPDALNADYDALSDGTRILIPSLTNDLHVNIIDGTESGVFNNTYTNHALEITDRTGATNTGKTATINFKSGLSGKENVVINTTANLTLGGTFKSTENSDGYEHQTIELQKAGSLLTLGLGDEGDFKTDNMVVKLTDATTAVTVDANEGTIAAINAAAAANTNTITVNSGTVTAIGGTTAAATPVTINGGKVETLKNTTAAVTINGGEVTTINNTTGGVTINAGATATNITTTTGQVTVNTGAIVSTVTTGAAPAITIAAPVETVTSAIASANTISVSANIETLKLSAKSTGTVTITGTQDADDDAVVVGAIQGTYSKNTSTDYQTINLTSTDKAAVGDVTFTTSGSSSKVNATSSISAAVSDLDDVKTTEIGDSKVIYTAAQLAGLATGSSYKFDTNITSFGGAIWVPLDLSGDFKLVQAHTITGLNAPLFNKVSGTSTIGDKALTIAGFTYTGAADEDNLGIIAKEVDGATVTISNVKVTGTCALTGDNSSENIGAAVGKAKVSTKLTLSGLEFANLTLTGHANVGGFIGNVAGGTVAITKGSSASTIALTLAGTYDATGDELAGTFGNIIGSVTGNASITIGATGNTLAMFVGGTSIVTNTNYKTTYYYNNNIDSEGKTLLGMYGTSIYTKQNMSYEIGYSPASVEVTMYGVTKDALDNPVSITQDDINQYE